MQFLGISSFFVDNNKGINTAEMSDVSCITLSNAKFDCLYCSINPDINQYSDGMPEWEKDNTVNPVADITVLRTDFNNTCNSNDIEFDVNDVSKIKIKKRENITGENYITIGEKDIKRGDDLKFSFADKLCATNKTYEYKIVPVVGNTEMLSGEEIETGTSETIECYFEGIYLYDGNDYYNCRLNVKYEYEVNVQSETITTLADRYPYIIRNSKSRYISGNVSGVFIEYINGEFNISNGSTYRNQFYEFLTNNNPKLLKTYDGRMMIVSTGDGITEDLNGSYQIPTTTFNYTEIGGLNSNDDLLLFGLLEDYSS